jgi:hypothetical protein
VDSERRSGETEAAFREVNERIEELTDTGPSGGEGTIAILCECSRPTCAEKITVTAAEYERIRDDPTLFFLCDGHEEAEVEDVVERAEAYIIARKQGAAADAALRRDPRRD